MLFPELEERMHRARRALDNATSDNIIELCKQWLALLAEYRAELYKLPDVPGAGRRSESSSRKDVADARKAVRAAIERTTRERNETEALLFSFTSVSGYGAVETFNGQKYRGYDDWELRAGGVARFSGGGAAGERLSVQEAVETAGLLRREEHVARGAASAGAGPATGGAVSPAEPLRVFEGCAR